MNTYIDLENIYNEKGSFLQKCTIRKTTEDNVNNFVLYDRFGNLAYISGEQVNVILNNDNFVTLGNENREEFHMFILTIEEFELATLKPIE